MVWLNLSLKNSELSRMLSSKGKKQDIVVGSSDRKFKVSCLMLRVDLTYRKYKEIRNRRGIPGFHNNVNKLSKFCKDYSIKHET